MAVADDRLATSIDLIGGGGGMFLRDFPAATLLVASDGGGGTLERVWALALVGKTQKPTAATAESKSLVMSRSTRIP
jgi:hypothetical protein